MRLLITGPAALISEPSASKAAAAAGHIPVRVERPYAGPVELLRGALRAVCEMDGVVVCDGWRTDPVSVEVVRLAGKLDLPVFAAVDGKLVPRLTVLALSGYGQSGKDTAGAALAARGWLRVSAGDVIREALYRLNPVVADGRTVQELVDELGWEKAKTDVPAMRPLMQRMGADASRDLLYDDVWVDAVYKDLPDGARVFVTDARFPNEAAAVKRFGGQVWRVVRPGRGPANDHPSETALDRWRFDAVLTNDGTVEELHGQVARLLAAAGLD